MTGINEQDPALFCISHPIQGWILKYHSQIALM